MAAAKDMIQTVKRVLETAQGATGEMLAEGLVHALKDGPEDRHELQAALLKMVKQVLTSARSDAELESEDTCKKKVDAAQAELNTRQAAVASATESLAQARATAASKKEALEQSRRQLTLEEEELKKVEALDEEKGKEVAVQESGKQEVLQLLEAMSNQGTGEVILPYLQTANAESPLVAALRSVLKKEPAQRIDFDLVALEHLQTFLQKKVADWEVEIKAVTEAKANIHAEALGAWAVREVAGHQVVEAKTELEAADAAVVEAEQKMEEAKSAETQEERVLAHYLTDLTLAGERVRQCSEALEVLAQLEAGQPVVEATTPPKEMDVDFEPAAKMDTVLDTEMGIAITA